MKGTNSKETIQKTKTRKTTTSPISVFRTLRWNPEMIREIFTYSNTGGRKKSNLIRMVGSPVEPQEGVKEKLNISIEVPCLSKVSNSEIKSFLIDA